MTNEVPFWFPDRLKYYDHDGNEIPRDEWIKLGSELSYRFLRATQITSSTDPKQSFLVSTMWSGHDMSPVWLGAPVICETMVWDYTAELHHEHTRQYHNAERALIGHQRVVDAVVEPLNEPLIKELNFEDLSR